MRMTMIALVLMGITGCMNATNNLAAYQEQLKKERSTGKRFDSLFMGIYLGMTSKQFYLHCWEMNKKKVFTDGSNNTAVLYKLNHGELKHQANMNFYPDFYNDKIDIMRVNFNYEGWAPWNRRLTSDSLLIDVLGLFKQWYAQGNPFIKMEDNKKRIVYVKLDGNRRIIIGKFDDMNVKVDYSDLSSERNKEQ